MYFLCFHRLKGNVDYIQSGENKSVMLEKLLENTEFATDCKCAKGQNLRMQKA
jgi:hypothetical protein